MATFASFKNDAEFFSYIKECKEYIRQGTCMIHDLTLAYPYGDPSRNLDRAELMRVVLFFILTPVEVTRSKGYKQSEDNILEYWEDMCRFPVLDAIY
jgi:hypothetical protein